MSNQDLLMVLNPKLNKSRFSNIKTGVMETNINGKKSEIICKGVGTIM